MSTLSAAPASGAGVVAAGAASAAPAPSALAPLLSTCSVSSSEPSETVSPVVTFSSCTTPPNGEGTSIVALSDSSVTSGSSSATVSPGETITSMTGTSAKSPMSGTRTSLTSAISLAPQTVQGGGVSASTPYFSIACPTTDRSTAPSSASARSAAIATWWRSTSKKRRSLTR